MVPELNVGVKPVMDCYVYTRAKVTGFVTNPVTFGTGFAFAFTHKSGGKTTRLA